MHSPVAWLMVALLLSAGACHSQGSEPSGPQPSTRSDAGLYADQLPERIQADLVDIETSVRRRVASSVVRGRLELRWPTLVAALYATGRTPEFVDGSGLTERGQALLDVLSLADDEALDPAHYHAPAVDDLLTELGELHLDFDPAQFALEPTEREVFIEWIRRRPGRGDYATDALLSADSPLPRIADGYLALREGHRRAAAILTQVELLLADGLLGYRHDAHDHNLGTVAPEEIRARGHERILRERLLTGFEVAVNGDMKATLADLRPKWPQYARLQEALQRYRAIAAVGGWPEVVPRRLPFGSGSHGVHVKALQERLRVEGYYEGSLTGRFNRETRNALMAYQRTHQLKDDGIVDQDVLDSLNRSAAYRVAQIEVTLDRWRHTRIGKDRYYIHINLPDFHGEVWKDGERLHRFRTIVGNQERFFSEVLGRFVFPNATPLISEAIDFIIFNPYWNVTPRITRELDENLDEDPDWYEKHDYEVRIDSGVRKVRQRPGKKNALGRVKFQLPNRFDIYLHDTPRRRMFRYPIRAFSHGCVRVQDPLKLAALLLEYDGRSSAKWRVKNYLAGGEEDWTQLDQPVPVHIEYYTVRVDAEGGVHFNADLYLYDQPLVNARLRGEVVLPID